jgi:hypothetical protein
VAAPTSALFLFLFIEDLDMTTTRTSSGSLAACLLAAMTWTVNGPAGAAPFTPASDQEIVQSLPQRLDSASRAQRAALARQPRQQGLALATARAAVDRARRHGDPRDLGLAQAALAPWWADPSPPPALRLLRAVILQSQHDFAAALSDLDALSLASATIPLAVQAQAGLTRAAVLQVTGRLSEARQACQALAEPHFAALGDALALPAQACLAELRSLQGPPGPAAQDLARLAAARPGDPWLALLRAELAERMGEARAAEARYREALGTDGRAAPDVYTRSAFADFLLAQGRDREALALTEGLDAEADALQLRRAIALRRLADPRAASARQQLVARFEAAMRRGEDVHQREQARLALDLTDQPEEALRLARLNWTRQKEPADGLLLLRAARASGRPDAAEPVRHLYAGAGWTDQRMAAVERRPS